MHARSKSGPFWSKVDIRGPNECWHWLGAKVKGRGVFHVNGRTTTAPRVAYELSVKKIDSGKFACHYCNNPSCVNPAHIYEDTNQGNIRYASFCKRLVGQNKTHCIHGHPLSGDNLIINSRGQRNCRICQRRHHSKYQKANQHKRRETARRLRERRRITAAIEGKVS